MSRYDLVSIQPPALLVDLVCRPSLRTNSELGLFGFSFIGNADEFSRQLSIQVLLETPLGELVFIHLRSVPTHQ